MRLRQTFPLEIAEAIVDQAITTGRQHEMMPLTVIALDSGGRIVAAKSEDGSGLMRFEVAMGKAYGALGLGLSTRDIRDRNAARPAFLSALAAASDGRCVPVPGGVLIQDAEGYAIGAIGISGDTSEKDEYCAITAIRIAGYKCDPAEPDPDWNS